MNKLPLPNGKSEFIFTSRPSPLPADLRIEWRVSLVVLILYKCSRNNRARFLKLHVLNWATRSVENRIHLLQALNGEISPDEVLFRIDPALNRAIDFAKGEDLLTVVKKRIIELTPKGTSLASEIDNNWNCMMQEKIFLNSVGFKLTEAILRKLRK